MLKNGIVARSLRKEGAMTTSELPAWTMEELWQGEQVNFAAHLAIMFKYLQAHGLDLDDFIRYVGTQVLPSWQRRGATVPIMLIGILRNVRANGGTVFEVTMDEARSEATVSRLLRPDVMDPWHPRCAGRAILGQVHPHRPSPRDSLHAHRAGRRAESDRTGTHRVDGQAVSMESGRPS
jgi:hypothetical protein